MKGDVRKILGSYSKEVIIEWLCNSYFLPLARRNIKEELEDTRKDFEFNKIDKELTPLLEKQKKLGQKPFNVSVTLEMEKNRERIKKLLSKQEKLLGIGD